MSRRNKKFLLIMLIIIIVSTGFIISKFGSVSAGNDGSQEPLALDNSSQENNESDQSVMTPDAGSIVLPLMKLIGALLMVVVGIYGFIFLLKKMMGRRFSGNRNSNIIEVLETSYIAQKKSISLVRFAERAVLVGVGDTGINVLAELNPEETAKIMANYAVAKPVSGFKNILNDARKSISSLNVGKLKAIQISKGSKKPQTA